MVTDNPIRDAEDYYDRLEREQEKREYIECGYCHGPIYKGDGYYDGDIYYPINGLDICGECIDIFLKKIRREYM